jgi:hypothetical protein
MIFNLDRFPLKGSKEYRILVSMTGLLIGLAWVARDEYTNPKWTLIPKAASMRATEIDDWNKQFGPVDKSKWAIPEQENAAILQALDPKKEVVEEPPVTKRATW